MCDSSLFLCVSAEPGESVTLLHVISGVTFERNSFEFAVKHIGKLEKFVKESVCMCVHVYACMSVSDWVEVASEKDRSLK